MWSTLTLAILCKSAVVELVLKRPRARRLRPWPRQASTAPQSAVTPPLSSWTNFRVTACHKKYAIWKISITFFSAPILFTIYTWLLFIFKTEYLSSFIGYANCHISEPVKNAQDIRGPESYNTITDAQTTTDTCTYIWPLQT